MIIGAAQKGEHPEMAWYGTLRSWCQTLSREDCASLLQQTLDEEKQADELLSRLGETVINQAAAATFEKSKSPAAAIL